MAGLLLTVLAGCFNPGDPLVYDVARPSTAPLPSIQTVSPASGGPGTRVELLGSGFQPGLTVRFDDRLASVMTVLPTRIILDAPDAGEGARAVSVENPDGTRCLVESGFTQHGVGGTVPVIDSVSWSVGPMAGGTPFEVRGRCFQAGSTVSVGGLPATGVTVRHGGYIEAVAPAAFGPPGLRVVTVTNPTGLSHTTGQGFTYVDLGSDHALILGTVLYQKRQALEEGLSGGTSLAPCPHVRVEALGDDPSVHRWTTYADGWGRYALVVESGIVMRVRAVSAGSIPPATTENLKVCTDDTTGTVYGLETVPFTPGGGMGFRADLVAPALGPYYPAGAFNVFAVTARAADLVQRETATVLPLLTGYWYAGNGAELYTSYYMRESGGSQPLYKLFVLGGVTDFLDLSDTDEYDDAVVAHEFAHFVQDAVSVNASPGGSHGGEMLVPNLAFSEGFADWFGCILAGSPFYRDTIGVADRGYMRIAFDCESVWWQLPVVQGEGSEETVTEVLWDLTDGAYPRKDRDGDGIRVSPGDVLRGAAVLNPDHHFPSLQTLLLAMISQGSLSLAGAQAVLAGPEPQGVSFPPEPHALFPAKVDRTVEGWVDSLDPYRPADPDWSFWVAASSGNPRNDRNGFNARRYYAFTVETACTVTVRLEIEGGGGGEGNLDLYLLDSSHKEIAFSRTDGPVEQLSLACQPGRSYFLEVRAFRELGYGLVSRNASRFRLHVVREVP